MRIKIKIRCKQCGERFTLRGKKDRGRIETGFKQCLCDNRDLLLQQIGNRFCKIAIVHDPLQALRLEENADLILSGHTHGGQLVLPFFGPVFLSKAYRPVSNGWYSLKRSPEDIHQEGKMLVSRGYGTNHLPLRYPLHGVPQHPEL